MTIVIIKDIVTIWSRFLMKISENPSAVNNAKLFTKGYYIYTEDFMNTKFSIGKIANLYDISKQTLIYYDNIGLLKPEEVAPNGYRYYSYRQLEKLDVILNLKETGMSLSEIGEYLKSKDIPRSIDLLKKQNEIVKEKIRHLSAVTSKMEKKITLLSRYSDIKDSLGVHVKEISRRNIVSIDISKDLESGIAIEKAVKDLICHIRQSPSLSIYSYNTICASLDKSAIDKCNFQNISSVFITVDEKTDSIHSNIMPQNTYACIYHRGEYENTCESYGRLIKFISERGYEMIGGSIELPLIDAWTISDKSKYITEIQIPIRPAQK